MTRITKARIRGRTEMMGIIMKKRAPPNVNVGEVNIITRSKAEEITIIVGRATVPSWATKIVVMIGRGATLIRSGDLVNLTLRPRRNSTTTKPRDQTFGTGTYTKNGKMK